MRRSTVEKSDSLAAVSDAFISARRAGRALSDYPGDVPATFAQAYALQDRSISLWPDKVAGWKIGMTPPAFRADAEFDRVAGPIFAGSVRAYAGAAVVMPVFDGGFAAIEAEFLFRIGRTIEPGSVEATPEAAADVVSAMHAGVEIASSPFKGINDLGPTSIISDFGNNFGLIVGDEIANWRDIALNELGAAVSINGQAVGAGDAAGILNGPLSAVAFLIGVCGARGLALNEGVWISTGAVTGVHEAAPGDVSRVDFGAHGVIELSLEAFKAPA